jgi:anti-sigma-K factor RskA
MTAHIANDLPRLLTGEARRDEVLTAAEHLRSCVDCQQELVSAVVAHASLTSAARFAPEIVSGLTDDLFVESEPNAPEPATSDELPDLSAVFAQVRKEAEQHSDRGSRWKYALIGAAATVAIGGGATAIYVAATNGSSTPTTVTRTVALAAYDKGRTSAIATMQDGDQMRVDAASLPRLTGKRYEVWLTNAARTQMQPVGWLGADGTAALTVPADLLSRFSDIEVSVQPLDAKTYDYSGTSVLRGGYA